MNAPDWQYSHIETDPEAIAASYARETSDCLPITAAVPMQMLGFSGRRELQAVAYLNVAKRGDLQRLYSRIQQTGDGDVTAAWRFLTGTQIPRQVARIDAEWTTPVPASVRIAFDLLAHRPFLEVAAQTGVIQCSFGGKPARGLVLSVSLPITAVELAVALAMTEPLARMQGRNN